MSMVFMAAMTFLLYVNVFAVVRSHRRSDKKVAAQYVVLIAHHVAILSGGAAFLIGIGFFINTAKGFLPRTFNWSVPLFFIMGLMSVLLFGAKFLQMAKAKDDPTPAGWRSGLSLITILVGMYVVFATCDHAWFFRDSVKTQAGIAAADFLGADDVKCGSGMVLMRIEKDAARYRCPNSIVFGSPQFSQPFVPWPSYREGMSVKLKTGIENMMQNAGK